LEDPVRLGDQGQKEDVRVLRLGDGCDAANLGLTTSEGYLLSRIDGRTPWGVLRHISGMDPAHADRCLEDWLKQGLVVVEANAAAPGRVREGGAGQACVDASLDLSIEVQEQVLAFSAQLDRPYHEILGVAADADVRTIKKAYYGLSKVYHPDRYFRRNLGDFEPLVESCFKKLLEAYELLSDPATRAEVQKNLVSSPPPSPQPAAEAAEAGPAAEPEQTGGAIKSAADVAADHKAAQREEAIRLETERVAAEKARAPRLTRAQAARRLRRRVKAGPHRAIAERKKKAKSFFESGMAAFAAERWLEAAGSVRLAMAFDPGNEAFREQFVGVQRKAHAERAKILIRQGETALDMRDLRVALTNFEEAIHYRPFDAELAFRSAKLAWQGTGELKKARDMASAACELEPESAVYRRTLGQIYKAAGLTSNARRELEAAVRLDPGDLEAKSELKSL